MTGNIIESVIITSGVDGVPNTKDTGDKSSDDTSADKSVVDTSGDVNEIIENTEELNTKVQT